jgi:hypothetical protein
MSEDLLHRLADFELNASDPDLGAAATEASARIASIYAAMMEKGATDEAIARAMLGATVALYDTLGLMPFLPHVLRMVADKLERQARAH